MARRKRRTAAKKKRDLDEIIRDLADENLERFERALAITNKRDRLLALRRISKERKRRAAAARDASELWQMAQGQELLSRRSGHHKTMFGEDPWEDRNARLAIIDMYKHVKRILKSAPQDEGDPKFIPDWLHGYLCHVEAIEAEKAREAVWSALRATDRCRGIPSKSRRIVREFLERVGFWGYWESSKRRCITLTDQHLRRVIDRGDPLLLSPKKAAAARKEAARRGAQAFVAGVIVAESQDQENPERWRLFLKRRLRADRGGYLDTADLVLERGFPEPGHPRDEVRFGPDDETPIGLGREVVRSWMTQSRRDPKRVELAKLFLRRRR